MQHDWSEKSVLQRTREKGTIRCTIYDVLRYAQKYRLHHYCSRESCQYPFMRISQHPARVNIFRDTRWEQNEISDGCLISRESWKRSRGKTRLADTCHEHRWSSPSLTSHFQPISRISSTFHIVLAIARFQLCTSHPADVIGTDVLRRRQNKTKIRTIAFDRAVPIPQLLANSLLSSCIYRNKIS